MNIHQLNMQFNAEEDRILLRLSTTAGEEYRFHLTRRFVKKLWPVLMQLLETDFKVRAPEKAYAAKDMISFERERALSKADFSTEYRSKQEVVHPLGETYALLTKLNVAHHSEGGIKLAFFTSQGKGIEFGADSSFLHIFCDLLHKVVVKSEWDLFPESASVLRKTGQGSASKVLH